MGIPSSVLSSGAETVKAFDILEYSFGADTYFWIWLKKEDSPVTSVL